MEHPELKEIDDDAKNFITSAYRIGISVILIQKFLVESNYKSTISTIHETLWSFNIIPDNYNCSYDSLIWRRYLTYILEIHEVSTLEQFEQHALQETIDYFNIDKTIFTKYWNDYNEFIQEIKSPLDSNWIFRAAHYFGFTFRGLSNKVIKKGIMSTPDEIYQIYLSKTKTHTFTNEDLTLCPKILALGILGDDLRKFWRFSHIIGNDSNTILEWTEVFTGTSTSLQEIENYLQQSLYRENKKFRLGE